MMLRSVLLPCAVAFTATVTLSAMHANAQEAAPPAEPPTLEAVATAADLVALVQVRDTDYEYTRGFPSGGTAFLGVLIPYKLTRPVDDIVEVYDEGLHEHECYFENPTVYEEGRRHLLFVRHNPEVEDQYLGLPFGCSLEALVTADNRYALRYPLDGLEVADDLAALAQPLEFRDNYAFPEDDDLTVEERNALLEAGLLVALDDGRYRYTHGILLSDLRPLLGEENLTLDRALRRASPGTPSDEGE